ncbi:TetR/AcrR family transcriptional regulator [Actinobacillus capsulatus]|uniref:TetR/AcrR family transcriptional regulator n=1 Tax=Actinobacillus capsulatus TaxID=717 RepID=UPI000372BDFF|nr:TetR family transcriptional regulator [Actinobacillus capsulatus]
MPYEKQDLRVVRTHKLIRNALIDLLKNQAFDKITVQDIVYKAMVNRATFYKYYSGKSDLAGEMIKTFKNNFAALQQERLTAPELVPFFQKASDFYFNERDLLLALWKIKTRRHHLWDDMHQMAERTFIAHAKNHYPKSDESEWQFQAYLFAVMLLNTLKYQLEKGERLQMKTLFKQYEQIIELMKK